MFFELLKVNFKSLKNKLLFSTFDEKIRTFLVVSIVTVFTIICFRVSYLVIAYVINLPVIGTLFVFRIIAISFLTSFFMIIFSSLIVSISTLYNSKDYEFLLSLPLNIKTIFSVKLFSVLIQSSWMILVLFIPFFYSFCVIKNINIIGFLIIILSIIIFTTIPIFLGVLISMILSFYFPNKRLKEIISVGIIILITVVYSLFRFIEPEKLLNPDRFDDIIKYLNFMQQPVAKWLASWWAAEVVRGVAIRSKEVIYLNFLKLFSLATLLVLIVLKLSKKIYYKGLFSYDNLKRYNKQKNNCVKVGHINNALALKEIKLVLREPIQWSQIIVVFALIAVYVFSVQKLPISHSYVRMTISFFNLGAVLFMVSALILRFLFVQPSLEHNVFWLLKSFPIRIKYLYFFKIFLFLPVFILISWFVIIITNISLKISLSFNLISIFFISFSVFVLAVTGFSLGILFPKPEYQSLAQIETSFGGLLFIIVSICYIILSLSIFAWPLRLYILEKYVPYKVLLIHSIDFLLVNLIYLVPSLYLGIKKFKMHYG